MQRNLQILYASKSYVLAKGKVRWLDLTLVIPLFLPIFEDFIILLILLYILYIYVHFVAHVYISLAK